MRKDFWDFHVHVAHYICMEQYTVRTSVCTSTLVVAYPLSADMANENFDIPWSHIYMYSLNRFGPPLMYLISCRLQPSGLKVSNCTRTVTRSTRSATWQLIQNVPHTCSLHTCKALRCQKLNVLHNKLLAISIIIMAILMACKITRRTRWSRLEVLKLFRSQDIILFIMYYIYVTSGPFLLIESIDSMIQYTITPHTCARGKYSVVGGWL